MASSYAALSKARRKQSKIAREREIGMEVISSVGEIATFGVGQAKKAETAWGEYEAGYGEIPGANVADIEKRPEWGDKEYFKSRFKGPEGEVTIGGSIYDREQITKAGSFLGSEASAILDDEARAKYLERTAPGRAAPPITKMIDGTEYEVDAKGNPISAINLEVDKSAMETARKGDIEYEKKRSIWIDQLKNPLTKPGTGVKTGVSQIPEDPYSYQNMLNAGTAQDTYTDKQRQPYLDNPENTWLDTWKKNLSKQIKEGGQDTTWYNQDGR